MRRLVVAVASVLVLSFVVGAWWLRPVEAARPTTTAVTPFQVELAFDFAPANGAVIGTRSFVVPAGKLLNLKYITSHSPTSYNAEGVVIQTIIDGGSARHSISTPYSGGTYADWLDRPLDLWAEDSSEVIVTVYSHSQANGNQVLVTLSGELI